MTNDIEVLNQDTVEPFSPIEMLSGPGDEEIDSAELDPSNVLETLDESQIEETLIAEKHPEEVPQALAVKRGYLDGPIPTDIAAPPGLSPKRAELARLLEWRRRTADEIGHLEEAHHRAVEALGGALIWSGIGRCVSLLCSPTKPLLPEAELHERKTFARSEHYRV
jgi:hypothetical protein